MLRSLLVASAFCAFVSNPSFARDVQVDVSDLDLSHPADVAVAYDRVEAAAKRACARVNRNTSSSPIYRAHPRIVQEAIEECVSMAMDETVAQVGLEALEVRHEERLAARAAVADAG